MAGRTKRAKAMEQLVEPTRKYTLQEAIELLKKAPTVKFDPSVEFSLRVGVDPKKSDQQVRGTVPLPHGTGKSLTVLVIAKGEKVKEALEAGADYAGYEDLFEKIQGGWCGFDAAVATPDVMREVGKLAKILGPRGLMPSPKAGTVTNEVGKAVREIKAGKVEFKVDKSGVINNVVGKLSFSMENLMENTQTLLQAISRAKPSTAKGEFIRSLVLSSTMGPGIKIDLQTISI